MAKTNTHMRLASAKLGDDSTFTRYIKVKDATKPTKSKPRNRRLPGFELPAIREGRTIYGKSVRSPDQLPSLLVSGHSNVKIGRDARVGKLKGYWIYTLSLEERATCPATCFHWQTCYGNNMPYAKRIDHRHPDFLPRLRDEIAALLAQAAKRAGSPGIIVRLHVLGDFHSVDYTYFWELMLRAHPKLVIFGYTAWAPRSAIGRAVGELVDKFPGRAMMRFSNGGMRSRSTVPIVDAEACPPGAFVCPEQTGQFDGCGKCGACWATLKNVAFLEH